MAENSGNENDLQHVCEPKVDVPPWVLTALDQYTISPEDAEEMRFWAMRQGIGDALTGEAGNTVVYIDAKAICENWESMNSNERKEWMTIRAKWYKGREIHVHRLVIATVVDFTVNDTSFGLILEWGAAVSETGTIRSLRLIPGR